MLKALRIGFALALLSAVACAKTGTKTGPEAPTRKVEMPAPAEVTKLASSSNAFAFDLYAKLKGTPGNLAMSPASITAALAMTWGGARGQTEAEMRKVLRFEGTTDTVMTEWGAISRALQDPSRPLKLRIANRLFGEKTTAFEAPFVEKTRSAYGAALEPVDFKNDFEGARLKINGWVEAETERRIKDLLPARSVDPLTRLVLVNAIYFLADWESPFEKDQTSDLPFTTAGGQAKKTPTMQRLGTYRLAEGGGVRVLEMPYKGGDAAMLFILPDKADGLAAVEASLSAAQLAKWTNALQPKLVLAAIPRFEVNPDDALSLEGFLKSLGMVQAFDPNQADFTGISKPADPRERLKIDKVLHKAFVKVDEKGTEAAAATAVMAFGAGAPPKMIEFRADHPFLFAIVDKPTGLVLFLGRVTDPTLN